MKSPQKFWFALAAFCHGMAGIAGAQSVPASATAKILPVNYTVSSEIVYAQGAAGPLKADVYVPNGAGPFPGVVFIHGGGWVDGNRNQMVKLIRELANSGYVGFTIEYDVNPVPYPASFHESLAAVRYFREHAAEFHLDPERVGVAGSSAGGELAALVALNPQGTTGPAAPKDDAIAPVRAAVILNGVLDLRALGDASSMVTNYLGQPCGVAVAACRDASPTAHVHAVAPAFFVGHGTADDTVPFAQADAFVSALQSARVQVRFFRAEGGPHTYWSKAAYYDANVKAIKEFLALALAPAGKPVVGSNSTARSR